MKVTVRAGLITAALALAGCGGGGGNLTDEFIGVWQYNSGTLSVTYPGSPASSSPVVGNVTLTRGATSDLIYTATANGDVCSLLFDVRGAVASVLPGTGCTLELTDPVDGTPYNLTLSPATWTLRLSGRVITENANGNCTEEEPAGSVSCTFSQSALLGKLVQ